MAYAWDHVQERWLERRLGSKSTRFETKVQVAGSSLEIDAAVRGAGKDAFFDFLTPHTVFENKAPSETFRRQDLLLSGARTLLYAKQLRLGFRQLDQELTQVVLCARATRELRRRLGRRELRPGVWEGVFCTRLVVVEADELDVGPETWPLLIHYADGPKLQEAVRGIVAAGRTEYYGVLWLLRKRVFQEVLQEMRQAVDETRIDVREAVEELGIGHVVESVGLLRVIEAVGLPQVIEAVGLPQVIEAVGLPQVIEAVGLPQVIEAVGLRRLMESVGVERVQETLRQIERDATAPAPSAPKKSRGPRRRSRD